MSDDTLGSVLLGFWDTIKDWPSWTIIPIFAFALVLLIATASSGLTDHTHDKYSGKPYPTK